MSRYGNFVAEKEFKITDPKTPRPQLNYIWNSRVLSGVNQNGGGVGAVVMGAREAWMKVRS